MNSYPPELLVQLAPVMFVAGLEEKSQGKPQDTFSVLHQRLREALLSQRKPVIWQSDNTKSFHVVLVDRDVRFPPRKSVPPNDPQFPNSHSPLSPLTPSSPLHPDGLIAPIWIRKHTNLIPSVFVLFLRMYETPPQQDPPRSPLDVLDKETERDREQEERKRDAELAAEISLRKKATNERGIKLTVVLIASRRMLDDLTLDGRLTFIRRQSGLDSRAALFVLSPVSQTELGEFINSLQQALYEPAIDYYSAHSKRVRRKRNRHSQAVTSYMPPNTSAIVVARPLRPEGWTVRYEYKMGCFAEFRGENDVALKHYQDAYENLVIMFGSTIILPPRTKRWAEAKVLSDCISLKIAKLYLYNNEHALALSHHSVHMRRFGDFSRGWGIGEETFEFWSWMARQHRAFAELVEQGSRSSLKIPVPKPPPSLGNASSLAALIRGSSAPSIELDALRSLGLNPSHTLQHPGYYYYMAARCTETRRERFQVAVDAEQSQQPVLSPGYANEKKVQHYAIILELYTKAYEIFKKHSLTTAQNQAQSRLTLWIAYRIAQTYHDSGDFQTAVRFFERIAKTYRREKWYHMLRPLLVTWYACARQLGDVELCIKLLLEMMGYDPAISDDPTSLQEDLILLLKSALPPSSEGPLIVDLSESQPIFDSNVVFWKPEVEVGELVPFQISLTAPTAVVLSSVPFSSLEIYLSEGEHPITLRPSVWDDANYPSPTIQALDVGDVTDYREKSIEFDTNLCWEPGNVLIVHGWIKSDVPSQLKVESLVFTIMQDSWTIRLPLTPCSARLGTRPAPTWLCLVGPPHFIPMSREDASFVTVKYRPHNVLLSISHEVPAYIDEEYPIQIDVRNEDARDLEIVIDILLLPSEYDEAVSTITVDDERSTSLIKDIPIGVLKPGANCVKTLMMSNAGPPGNRVLDVSVRSRSPSDHPEQVEETADDGLQNDTTEILHTLIVPTVEPFKMSQEIVYRRSTSEWPGVADLRTFDGDHWDDRGGEAIVNVRVGCSGPWPIEIESIVLERENSQAAKILDSALELDADAFPSDFDPGDDFNDVCRISIAYPVENHVKQEPIPGPGRYIIQWRRIADGSHGERSFVTTTYHLPAMQPPSDGLIALLKVPSMMTLHRPTPLVLLVRNYHRSRSANITVHLETDAQDGFVVAGLRNGRLPILLPGAEEKVVWQLVPLESGYVKLPNIRVVDRRRTLPQPTGGETHSEGETVRVVDIRIDQRRVVVGDTGETSMEESADENTILVLPK